MIEAVPDPSAPTLTESPAATPPGSAAGQLVSAFLTGLVLILPLRAVLPTTTYGALYGWLFAAAALTVVLGLLLRLTGAPRAVALVLLTSGVFAGLVVLTLFLLAASGDPGGHSAVALLAGLPSAALAAPVSVALVRRPEDDTTAAGLGVLVCLVGLTLAASVGSGLGERLDEARDDAQDAEALADSGLTPYLPEIDGLRGQLAGITWAAADAGGRHIVGYSLRYEQKSTSDRSWDSADIYVSVGPVEGPACEEIDDYLTCTEGDGYVVTEREGVVGTISADLGSARLEATLGEGEGDLPDASEVGEALAGAEQVDWEQIVESD